MAHRIDRARITDLVLGKLSPEEALKVLEEVESSPEASREMELAVEVLNFARGEGQGEFARQEGVAERGAIVRDGWSGVVSNWLRPPRLVYGVAVAVTLAVAGIGTRYFLAKGVIIPEAETEWIEWATVRFSETSSLLSAQDAFQRGDPETAYDELTRYIRVHPEDPLKGEVRYNAALLCFDLGRDDLAGFPVGYDTLWISRGIGLLDELLADPTSAPLHEGAQLLRARGLIAVGRSVEAEPDLRAVSEARGRRAEEARKLLLEVRGR